MRADFDFGANPEYLDYTSLLLDNWLRYLDKDFKGVQHLREGCSVLEASSRRSKGVCCLLNFSFCFNSN